MDAEDDEDLQLEPFDWERFLRWVLILGLIVWVVAGSIQAILLYYFGNLLANFVAGSATEGRLVTDMYKVTGAATTVAFRIWIAAAVLVAFMWARALLANRTDSSN